MEDALVPMTKYLEKFLNSVLILVLMEDALVPESSSSIQNARATSLNPCFNGRCTRTAKLG